MTSRQTKIFFALAALAGLTRFAAVARSMWDWDEALFTLAVADYDVYAHRPHPPGYPLFIAAAKLIHLLGPGEFRSLQSLVVLGALFVFPAVFFLARELGFDFATSIGGALIFAFLPNVWLYGGTAFSDVPATVLGLAACTLLLRGRRDARAYVAGAVVLAISVGIRPANLLLAAVPAALATIARHRGVRSRSRRRSARSSPAAVTPVQRSRPSRSICIARRSRHSASGCAPSIRSGVRSGLRCCVLRRSSS
jgi:4-amino-4-deoxy-L-arabinose transferase-like glycosyltransferase